MVSFRQAAVNLGAYGDRARTVGGRAAANAMAECGRDADKMELVMKAHPAHTKTPSHPGESPAMISGRLMAAQDITEAVPAGPNSWESHAGPNRTASSYNGPYGRIQELGGTMFAHTERGMRWYEVGETDLRRGGPAGWHQAMAVDLPSRPYLFIALNRIVADGSLHAAAIRGFEEAMGL